MMLLLNQAQSITNVLLEALVRMQLLDMTAPQEKTTVRMLAGIGLRLTGYEGTYAELDQETAELAEVTPETALD